MLPPKAERGRWDPFPADFDSGDEEDEDEDGNGDGEGVAEGGEEGVQPEGEWLEALARHVEQQLEAATAGSAEETPAAAPTRASARVGVIVLFVCVGAVLHEQVLLY